MNRKHARPKLSTVNDALQEIRSLVLKSREIPTETDDFIRQWNEILDKYDINYNDTKRWNEL